MTSLCSQWTKNKSILFLYYTRHDMNLKNKFATQDEPKQT